MAGHSKWANIKHKKKKEDKKRAKLFSKLSKKITVAAREGGGDPEYNSNLRMYIEKAKQNNMPKENIERAVKKGTGELPGVTYEDAVYECYGPNGVALYIEVTTDNTNRTVGEIRHILDNYDGNMGEDGSVAWMFNRKGLIYIDRKSIEEEELTNKAIESGVEDIEISDEAYILYCDPRRFHEILDDLKKLDLNIENSEMSMIPKNTINLNKEAAKKILNLMDELEDHDDVQNVHANFEIDDKIINQIMDE
ncbi:MAG: YebC/PmpR family DNA-binding transcriptional regulator [Candidatus Mcinerneyibacterium aminivorans]|uniref:Probable transcriptional regulatory protein FXF47_04360 n=1 Tax=Candidatus Mcinerneyibacterium aminivorans TaxID=2703815 RepID=A0A5D0MIX4_9BACT|nr:MAG: YebC/PmpR family DNA-binding transcriptional regulator [Candidatus Mcinerneyibacterium aminivorans]